MSVSIEPSPDGGRATRTRIAVLATEDWFVASHFLPLLRALVATGADVAVVTRVRDKREALLATGVRLIDFDFKRGDLQPVRDAATGLALGRLLRRENVDAVHAIALKPIALACAALFGARRTRLALHLTGVGFSGTSRSLARSLAHAGLTRLIARTLAGPNSWLFVENPDDVAELSRHGAIDESRLTILPGAGVDPGEYPDTPLPPFRPPSAGFVGRMIWSKGVDVLMEAHRRLRDEGFALDLRLCGEPDAANPGAVTPETLRAWGAEPGVQWLGRVNGVAGFWRETGFAAVPSRGGEGLPRALLEAAACGRPVVVTGVPGCRHFVRDGVEGFVVPAEDPAALADAMRRLASDPGLAGRMGEAARRRVLDGYTEAHVMDAVADAYRRLVAAPRT